jgi:hypothetical protein
MARSVRGTAVRRSSRAPIVVGASIFAAVLCVVSIAAYRDREDAGRSSATSRQTAAPIAELGSPSAGSGTFEVARLAQTPGSEEPASPVSSDARSKGVVAVQPVKAAETAQAPAKSADRSVDATARVEAQLNAGEFGPAMAVVQSIDDDDRRTRLLRMVADAQMEAGEFRGAQSTIGRIPNTRERVQAQGERAGRQTMAGGGVNIDQLIELIQNNTGEPEGASWSDSGGIGTIDTWNPGGMSDGGVRVDPNGLLYRLTRAEQTGRLEALGAQARRADLNDDMARPSSLRLVSLSRLEREVAKRLADGELVVASMRHLAGLSQVRYVFVIPEEKDIVIGGPAEGWEFNENGVPVG